LVDVTDEDIISPSGTGTVAAVLTNAVGMRNSADQGVIRPPGLRIIALNVSVSGTNDIAVSRIVQF
jgi:hypothetical protein